jgi:hypothetical protein
MVAGASLMRAVIVRLAIRLAKVADAIYRKVRENHFRSCANFDQNFTGAPAQAE